VNLGVGASPPLPRPRPDVSRGLGNRCCTRAENVITSASPTALGPHGALITASRRRRGLSVRRRSLRDFSIQIPGLVSFREQGKHHASHLVARQTRPRHPGVPWWAGVAKCKNHGQGLRPRGGGPGRPGPGARQPVQGAEFWRKVAGASQAGCVFDRPGVLGKTDYAMHNLFVGPTRWATVRARYAAEKAPVTAKHTPVAAVPPTRASSSIG